MIHVELQIFFILKLWHDIAVMYDWSDDQLREKSDKQEIVHHGIFLGLSSITVNDIGNKLKSKKGYANR